MLKLFYHFKSLILVKVTCNSPLDISEYLEESLEKPRECFYKNFTAH